MNNKYKFIGLGIFVIIIIIILAIIINSKVGISDYSNANFKVSYDSTWKVKNKKDELYLVHKKSKAEIRIQCKILDTNYMDASLEDLIDDIANSIEEQNTDYKLINRDVLDKDYDAYAYLYEKDDSQVLVNIYKKDNKLIIAYYEAKSEYFDIVLDSADTIFNSLEFVFE